MRKVISKFLVALLIVLLLPGLSILNPLILNAKTYDFTTPVTVVNSSFYTDLSSKIQVLSNGWLVVGLYDHSSSRYRIYKSVNQGNSWSELCYLDNSSYTSMGLDYYNASLAPTLSISSPINGSSVLNSMQLSGTVSDLDVGDILTTKYNIDGGAVQTVAGTVTTSGAFPNTNIDTSGLTPGAHMLNVWVEDNQGGTSSITSRSFTKQTEYYYNKYSILSTSCSALLHFNGSDGSTIITDESGKSWTNSSTKISTGQSMFGGSSLNLGGSSDWIHTLAHDDFIVGANDFTVDFWMKRVGVLPTLQYFFGQADNTGSYSKQSISIKIDSNIINADIVYNNGSSIISTNNTTSTADTNWHHIALVRNGGIITLYIDGVAKGTCDIGAAAVHNGNGPGPSGGAIAIGRLGMYGSYRFSGFIDEFRFTKGIARWTSNFTSPTTESTLNTEYKRSLVQANIKAVDGTYPDNGIQGGYWYVKGVIVNDNPAITVATPVEGTRHKDTISLTGNVIDANTGDVISVMYNIDGGATKNVSGTVTTSGNYQQTIDISTVNDGSHTINIWAQDNTGKLSAVHTVDVIVDNTGPTITANTDYAWKSSDITVSLSAIDALGTMSQLKYELSTSATLNGTYPSTYNNPIIISTESATNYIHYKAVDDVGNVTTGSFGPYRIDKSSGVVTSNNTDYTWKKDNISVSLNYIDSLSGMNIEKYELSTNAIPSGTYPSTYSGPITISTESAWNYIHYKGIDNVGHETTGTFGPYKLDKTAPTVVADNTDYTKKFEDIVVNLDYSDSLSGISTKKYELSTSSTPSGTYVDYTGPITISTELVSNYIHYKSVDNAGNEITGTYGPYILDKAKPSVLADNRDYSWKNSDITVNLSYTGAQDLDGLIQYEISTSATPSGSYTDYTGPITISTESAYNYIHFKAIDVGGNVVTGSYGPYRLDKTAPTNPIIKQDVNSNGDYSLTVISSMDTLSGIDNMWYKIGDDSSWEEYSEQIIIPSDELCSVYIKVKDLAGNETLATNTVGIVAPSNVEAQCDANQITISYDELNSAIKYEIEVDGLVIDNGLRTTYIHKNLKPDTEHYYRVRAVGINNKVSQWSNIIIASTTISIPNIPNNISQKVYDTFVVIRWDENPNIEKCEIEFDGKILDSITTNYYEISELEPNSVHEYRLKAINKLGESEWSTLSTLTTTALPAPVLCISNVSDNSIEIGWNKIEGTTNYEIMIDNDTFSYGDGDTTSYQDINLIPNTMHDYSVRAVNTAGTSAWSTLWCTTLPTQLNPPNSIRATETDSTVKLIWDVVEGATAYDVELDGVVIENGLDTTYTHTELYPFSVHKYRVRSRNNLIESPWSDYINVTTLPGKAKAPNNICISTVGTVSTISWDPVPGSIGYYVEVDGRSIPVFTTSYINRDVSLGQEHIYRVKSTNLIGTSDWSGYIVNNSIKAISTKGEELNLALTASNITDFSKYVLNVYYNKDVLNVTDLCAKTTEAELSPCKIDQEGITITDFEEGKITFTVDKAIEQGYDWTGIINNIIFKGQVTGGTTIDYTVYILPEE